MGGGLLPCWLDAFTGYGGLARHRGFHSLGTLFYLAGPGGSEVLDGTACQVSFFRLLS